MAKIKLGTRPKSFKHTVTVPLLDGTSGTLECVFRYRTRKEFGEFVDALAADARAAAKKAEEEAKAAGAEARPYSLKEYHEKGVETNADYVLGILESWNLDVELSRDAVQQLADELPGVSAAIVEAYRLAIAEGRLGN